MNLKRAAFILGFIELTGGAAIMAWSLRKDNAMKVAKQKKIDDMNRRTEVIMDAAWYESQNEQAKEDGEDFEREIKKIQGKIKDPDDIIKEYTYRLNDRRR